MNLTLIFNISSNSSFFPCHSSTPTVQIRPTALLSFKIQTASTTELSSLTDLQDPPLPPRNQISFSHPSMLNHAALITSDDHRQTDPTSSHRPRGETTTIRRCRDETTTIRRRRDKLNKSCKF